jgi:hypothetical protein
VSAAQEELVRLLDRLEAVRAQLESTDDPEAVIETLGELAQLAKDVQAEIERAKRESDAVA